LHMHGMDIDPDVHDPHVRICYVIYVYVYVRIRVYVRTRTRIYVYVRVRICALYVQYALNYIRMRSIGEWKRSQIAESGPNTAWYLLAPPVKTCMIWHLNRFSF
jgi:hypothetical protein